ncbi:MAG: molybdate ABC transporter permease subunit [Sporocytophaga sp.]|uniref:molybdate ABC transporter permease subunit n=1 Tax=Sporocytophaga sp. TaxID=2231183 RepID=UPI001B16365E|nr:molybdate ABC transporter permease subunit [Sporocytophaga sp.]MBO9702406.1 molybdate ABC transporter permease subunit [Sporocytophaga sp.]
MDYNLQPLLLSLKLSLTTTLLLFVIGVPIAYWLSKSKSSLKPFWESLISLPLVLPPSVLGFYLLLAFSPNSIFGRFLKEHFDLNLIFSFEGLVIASVIYSLPFMVHPVQSGFQSLPDSLKEAAYTLGISPLNTFVRVLLPNIRPSLLSGIVLSFAHTVGEFGVVLMIGGSIPGVTRVASIAIYEEVDSMHYDVADFYAKVLILASFIILFLLFLANKKYKGKII